MWVKDYVLKKQSKKIHSLNILSTFFFYVMHILAGSIIQLIDATHNPKKNFLYSFSKRTFGIRGE